MNPTTSKNLHFVLSSTEDLKQAITELSGVFHVIPSASLDAELPLLSVEVDDDFPHLVDEVRRIVEANDPASTEVEQAG
ncbi:hypothetical protein [Aeromicrobium sp.]|uniref:hypothetical protein n=1 Tax=Aeromicrobium sp. TaxID=1871063 RepID=UPI0030C072E6